MCTVSLIPTSDGFYFTSSRDERSSRPTIPPARYTVHERSLIYPKDEKAGGTWIASDSTGKTACLLNGAFINHKKEATYRKSRGMILLESFNFASINEFSTQIDLINIEPFTLLILDHSYGTFNRFDEFRWDGKNQHLKSLSITTPQIWSSATLYSQSVQDVRKQLFENWVEKHKHFEDKMILDFHNRRHGLESTDDLLMKGYNGLRTLSISQVHMKNANSAFKYLDLMRDKTTLVKVDKCELENV